MKNTMRFFFLAILVALSACGGGGGGGDNSGGSGSSGGGSTAAGSGSGGSNGPTFINWANSSNGATVLAANNVPVQFVATSGSLYFNGTEYANVNVNNATVFHNGSVFGSITLVPGTNSSQIAALLCTNGNYAIVSTSGMGCSSTGPSAGGSTGTGTSGTGTSGSGTSGSGTSGATVARWVGNWSWSGSNGICNNYQDAGVLSMTITVQGSTISSSDVSATGVQTRNLSSCILVSTGTASGSLSGSLAGTAATISNLSFGTLDSGGITFTGSGTMTGTTFTGTIARTGGSGPGSFTLTKQ